MRQLVSSQRARIGANIVTPQLLVLYEIYAAYSDAVVLQSSGVATNSSQRRVPVQVNQLCDKIITSLIGDQIAVTIEPDAS